MNQLNSHSDTEITGKKYQGDGVSSREQGGGEDCACGEDE